MDYVPGSMKNAKKKKSIRLGYFHKNVYSKEKKVWNIIY